MKKISGVFVSKLPIKDKKFLLYDEFHDEYMLVSGSTQFKKNIYLLHLDEISSKAEAIVCLGKLKVVNRRELVYVPDHDLDKITPKIFL